MQSTANVEHTKQHSIFETIPYTYPFHTQILCTNRQIYTEAISVFHRENIFIRFSTNHPTVRHFIWLSQGVLSLTLRDCIGSFGRIVMDVNHYCRIPSTTASHERCDCMKVCSKTCVLVLEQLPNLLRTLRATSQQGTQELASSSFLITIFDILDQQSMEIQRQNPTAIQSLLDPFKLLHAVEFLDINGPVNEKYKRSVIASARQPEPTVAEIITAASAIEEKAEEAFREEQFDLSLSLCQSALREFQVNRYWPEYTGKITTGEYAGLSTPEAVRLFKVRIHQNLALAFLKAGQFQKAIGYAKEAIRYGIASEVPVEEGRFLVTQDVLAIPFHWGGLAYEGLGDLNRALYGIGEALHHSPESSWFEHEREYKRLEAEMEKQGIVPATHSNGKGTSWY